MKRAKEILGKFFAHYWFTLPALAIYVTFVIYPMISSSFISLHKWDGISPTMEYVGLQNYITFFTDPVSIKILLRTLIWTACTVAFPTLLGLMFAVALNRPLRGRTAFRAIFYSPYVLPLVGLGIIWSWLYNPMFGAFNELLKMVGLSSLASNWLSDPKMAFSCVIVTSVWQATGFPMIMFLAGLQQIDQQLYEAAWIDGANYIQSFFHITIPQLTETFIIVIAFSMITSFRAFQIIYIMTWGGPARSTQVLGVWMYFNTFLFNKAGFGSAIAVIMAVISLSVAIPFVHFLTRKTS